MQRLSNNTYALQFEPNQEKMIDRQNYFKENFEKVPNYKAQRKLGILSADQVSQLPVELQREYQYDVLSFYKQIGDETEELMLNYNGKLPTSVKAKVYWENRKEGSKRAEFKKARFLSLDLFFACFALFETSKRRWKKNTSTMFGRRANQKWPTH